MKPVRALAGWIPLGAGEPFYPAYACTRACFTEVNLSNLSEARSSPRRVQSSSYFGYYHSRAGFRSIRYVHQKTATIAVPADHVCRGRERLTPETAIHPTAQQWASARILSHPVVAPDDEECSSAAGEFSACSRGEGVGDRRASCGGYDRAADRG